MNRLLQRWKRSLMMHRRFNYLTKTIVITSGSLNVTGIFSRFSVGLDIILKPLQMYGIKNLKTGSEIKQGPYSRKHFTRQVRFFHASFLQVILTVDSR